MRKMTAATLRTRPWRRMVKRERQRRAGVNMVKGGGG
jgi:hypothetical protein